MNLVTKYYDAALETANSKNLKSYLKCDQLSSARPEKAQIG